MKKNGKIPKTKFEDLVEFYKEIKFNENIAFARVKAGVFDKNSALLFLKEKKYETEKRYSELLHPEDKHEFGSLRTLRKFLERNGFDDKDISKSIKHERAHYIEALAQGFDVKNFFCWIVDDSGKKDYVCSTQIACDKMPSHRAYKKASNAPENPSYIDRFAI